MKHYAGIDVSLNSSSVCVVDESGKIVREVKVASEPVALINWFKSLCTRMERIGLEAGPLSQWLYGALRESGLPVELLETRHVKAALSAMPVKTDRNDARGLAQLMRLGWFRPVHCKSIAAQEVRALLTARKLVQSKLYDIEMSLRGILRGFGLKVGPTTSQSFAARINHLVAGQASLETVAQALLSVHAAALREFKILEKQVRQIGRADERVRLLSVGTRGRPAGGAHLRFRDRRSKAFHLVEGRGGPHIALTPKKYQSGETDITGRISKIGDSTVRAVLYVAAHIILTRPIHGGALKSWAMRLAKRAGMKKAKVALARKLAVVLHRMWVSASTFDFEKAERLHARRGLTRGFSGFRRGSMHQAFPKRSPVAGTMDEVDRDRLSGIATTLTRLAGLILNQTPSGGGLAPTPDRSESSATG